MSELGQLLKQAREEKGITLDDIQKTTKIQKRYLEAIERGHYHLLPGHFYARAFIKSYAEAIGLDSHQILSHYQADIPAQANTEQLERLRRRRVSQSSQPLHISKWLTQSLLILFVVLIGTVIYISLVNNPSSQDEPIEQEQTTPVDVSTQAPLPEDDTEQTTDTPIIQQPAESTDDEKVVLSFVKKEKSTFFYTMKGADSLSVSVKGAKGNCWLEVYDSKNKRKKLFFGNLAKDTEKTFELEASAYVLMGAPFNVEVSVNGQPVDLSNFPEGKSVLDIQLQSNTVSP